MKTIIQVAIVSIFTSCSSTPTTKWDAATASKTCFNAATKGKYDLDDAQLKRLHGICDCVGQKMINTFKTEQEANDKMLDAAGIANDCKEEYRKKEIENFGK